MKGKIRKQILKNRLRLLTTVSLLLVIAKDKKLKKI